MKEFVESLETPRRILLMVKAGVGTDAAIDSLKPYLDKGDIIIDGGNTFFRTPFVVIVSFLQKALTSLVPVSLVVRKAR